MLRGCYRLVPWKQVYSREVLGQSQSAEGFPGDLVVKNPPADTGDCVQSLGREDTLEEEMATCILAWKILWTEEFGGLQ